MESEFVRSMPIELRPYPHREDISRRLQNLFRDVKGVTVLEDRGGVVVEAKGFRQFTSLMFKTRSILRQADLLDRVCLGVSS